MPRFPRPPFRSWMIVLMLVLGFVPWDGGVRINHVQGLTSRYL